MYTTKNLLQRRHAALYQPTNLKMGNKENKVEKPPKSSKEVLRRNKTVTEDRFNYNEAIARASGEYDFHIDYPTVSYNSILWKTGSIWKKSVSHHTPTGKKTRLSSFTLFNKPQYYLTFSCNYMRFSNSCIEALSAPDYIQIYISKDKTKMLIKSVDPTEPRHGSWFSFLHKWKEKAKAARVAGKRIPQREAKIGHAVPEFRRIFGIKGTRRFKGEVHDGMLVFELK